MKYIFLIMLFSFYSCGNKPMVHNNKIYNCYGIFDIEQEKKQNVLYELDTNNIIGTFFLMETLIVPIWNLGWNTYCPKKILE